MCVNLIPGHTYYEHSVWPENGVTEWYQSCVDHRNAGLVRRVIFLRLVYNQNHFTSSLFKTSSLLLILSGIFLFLAPLLWKRCYRLSSDLPQNFWYLQVHIFASKHLNEV
jgi:hypothetical protein